MEVKGGPAIKEDVTGVIDVVGITIRVLVITGVVVVLTIAVRTAGLTATQPHDVRSVVGIQVKGRLNIVARGMTERTKEEKTNMNPEGMTRLITNKHAYINNNRYKTLAA